MQGFAKRQSECNIHESILFRFIFVREIEYMKAHLAEISAQNKELAAAHRLQYASRPELEATSLSAFNNEDLTKAMDEYG